MSAFPTPISRRSSSVALLLLAIGSAPLGAAEWRMGGRDATHTNRADYAVPVERQNGAFFDWILWQTPTPDSPVDGELTSTTMVFFDGAGPGGADVVLGTYHWPKGIQAMDRHSGQRFWFGLPAGGETIGTIAPAFSSDGSVIYVVNDASPHPLMAFSTIIGPSSFWHNGNTTTPDHLSAHSPTIAADGRIFLKQWNNRPYAGADLGTEINEVWGAEFNRETCFSDPTLYQDGATLRVVTTGRVPGIATYHGGTGSELWRSSTPAGTDATATVNPTNGNIYVAIGFNHIHVAGLTRLGAHLWGTNSVQVYTWEDGVNQPERAIGNGALSHDGATFYFQTSSEAGEGKLYAVNTANGAVRWTMPTGSSGWEISPSGPIVTPNRILVVGNNNGGTYYAVRDNGSSYTVLDTLHAQGGGVARATATLSPDGILYLPLRTAWTVGNGNGDVPSGNIENLFVAFDITRIGVGAEVFGNGFED